METLTSLAIQFAILLIHLFVVYQGILFFKNNLNLHYNEKIIYRISFCSIYS
jgi:hypothetical protein